MLGNVLLLSNGCAYIKAGQKQKVHSNGLMEASTMGLIGKIKQLLNRGLNQIVRLHFHSFILVIVIVQLFLSRIIR